MRGKIEHFLKEVFMTPCKYSIILLTVLMWSQKYGKKEKETKRKRDIFKWFDDDTL